MKKLAAGKAHPKSARLLGVALWLLVAQMGSAQQVQVQQKVKVADGWHPWYQVKADPEDQNRIIICGSKWESQDNALYGFVYASKDGGRTWRTVLTDKNSTWVSEQSCAFGPNHVAYFISEASKVILGKLHHDLGVARLFVSPDGGQHWAKTLEVPWADWSTSVVSPETGNLVTFFNSMGSIDKRGSFSTSVGVLLFSRDGKSLSGPFLAPDMEQKQYRGVFTYDAFALKNGTVGTVYLGRTHQDHSTEWEYDLGFLTFDPFGRRWGTTQVLAHPIANVGKNCFPGNISLSYEGETGELMLVYSDSGPSGCDLLLTKSEDYGATWTKAAVVQGLDRASQGVSKPSLSFLSDRGLSMLWQDSSSRGHWLFSYLDDSKFILPAIELSQKQRAVRVFNQSLMTNFFELEQKPSETGRLSSTEVGLQVRSPGMGVWRSGGLVQNGHKLLAVFLEENEDGESLSTAVLRTLPATGPEKGSSNESSTLEKDVTGQVVILYGGFQSFDMATGTLSLSIRLFNKGDKPLRFPIKLRVENVRCPGGTAVILNASNGLSGVGGVWDFSSRVAGEQILPAAASSRPLLLSFRLDLTKESDPAASLLDLTARVFAKGP